MFYLSDLLLHVIGFGLILAAPASFLTGAFFIVLIDIIVITPKTGVERGSLWGCRKYC